ncbi:MAG: DUF5057 domain-containing protein [Lachnospiraceae bacterium]|nr:DUF5057 domain-containing protein [Lachnospiraceae bacterium]
MKLNRKIMISALSVVLLMALAVTALTFSLADDPTNDEVLQDVVIAQQPSSTTNIDYIIQNSYDEDEVDDVDKPIADTAYYRIVEIGSGASSPSFQAMIADGSFKDFVIDGNRTIEDTMKSGDLVSYNYFQASKVTDDNEAALATIAAADFIYVSQDSASPYIAGNDFGESLYNLLHSYAIGSYKPLVIDSPEASSPSIGGTEETMTMASLATDYFGASGIYYSTYEWNASWSLDYFLAGAIGSDSMYIPIIGRDRQSYWTEVTAGENKAKMAKFLVVSDSGNVMNYSGSLGYRMFNEALTANTSIYTDADGAVIPNVYYCDGLLETAAYNQRYVVPDCIQVEEVALASLETSQINFDDYDMIIIEAECGPLSISVDLYKKFVAAMYANVHITYDGALATNTAGGAGSSDAEDTFNDTNYKELFYMVATANGIARYQNVMITDATEFGIIATSKSASTCKIIADLINNSSYRGIGGPGSTSTMFTVLEIQPCYPIDTAIAEANGSYYTIPYDVINGQTREQLGMQIDENGNTVVDENVVEYYAWELSEAKIADALGMSASQVKVVHMSSEELATNKDVILGNYDMVYIGGNRTALKDATQWNSLKALHNDFRYTDANGIEKLPIYTMYTHTGDMVKNLLSVEEGPVQSGSPINAAPGKTSGNTFVTLNGNDITYDDVVDLKKFVDAGMPVVISDDVANVYVPFIQDAEKNGTNPYYQNSIDPDSHMCDFLDYCVGQDSVLWGFDVKNTELVDNDGGRLGSTMTGYVEVFAGDSKAEFNSAYTDGNKRLKLAVTNMPAPYNVYDPSSRTKYVGDAINLNYELDIIGLESGYTIYMYLDSDKNSIFDADEKVGTYTDVESLTLALQNVAQYGEDYSGPVYWKLEVVDNATGAKSSTQQLAYVEPANKENADKTPVNVLQILPDESIQGAYGANSWVSLIFCTECQRAIEILDRNPGYEGGYLYDNNYGNLYDGKIGDNQLDANGYYNGIYTGRHQHTFGVVKYDSESTVDDWYYNFADDVSDMYDFSIDIMTSREFEAADAKVRADFATFLATYYPGVDTATIDPTVLETDLQAYLAPAQAAYDAYVTLDDVLAEKYDGKAYGDLTPAERTVLQAGLTTANGELALAEAKLLDLLIEIKDASGNAAITTALNNIYNSRQYADYVISFREVQNLSADWHYTEYKTLYEAYALALDKKLALKDDYDAKLRLANYDNWLLGCYDSVIIGPAESFCGDDIKTDGALETLKGYMDGDGHMLLFHDTLTKYSDAGSQKLTDTLMYAYGMDKNHAVLDTALATGSQTVTSTVQTPRWQNNQGRSLTLYVGDNAYGTQYNNLNFSNAYDEVTFTCKINDQNSGKVSDGKDTDGASASVEVKFTFNITNADGTPYSGNFRVVFADDTKEYAGVAENGVATVYIPNYTTAEVTSTYTADDAWFLPYTFAKDEDGNVAYASPEYKLPELSYRGKTDNSRYFTWKADMTQVYAKLSQASARYYSPMYAYTDSLNLGHNDNEPYSPYKYATVEWHACTQNGYAASVTALGSNKASKTNDGLVTLFPFTLSDELNIAPTHAQAYALDVENEDLSVWYTIAGGNNNKAASEMQGATPHDGTDNYFIYSLGNLNYCGAGHTKVTGQNKDNNDERMLYINIICNSVTMQPKSDIKVYDYTSTDEDKTNEIVKDKPTSDYDYIIKLDEDVVRPDFSFEYDLAKGKTLRDIKIYYNLDDLNSFNADNDKLIKQFTSATAKEGELIYVPESLESGADFENLLIDPSYLTDGKYVDIVIALTDTEGKTTYKVIRVQYKDKLFNLT